MQTATAIEICEIREYDPGWWGDRLGFWCEGHVDKQQFAEACDREYGPLDNPIHPSHVEHGYLAKVQVDEFGEPLEDDCYLLERRSRPMPGAFAATYIWG